MNKIAHKRNVDCRMSDETIPEIERYCDDPSHWYIYLEEQLPKKKTLWCKDTIKFYTMGFCFGSLAYYCIWRLFQ